MPRKPFREQKRYSIFDRGRGYIRNQCRRDVLHALKEGPEHRRYVDSPRLGVIRIPGKKALLGRGSRQ